MRSIRGLLLMGLIFSVLVPAPVRALSDIDLYPHKSAIDLLHARGIIDGYPDGTFRPYKAINRAEFLKLLMLSVYGDQGLGTGSGPCFTDFIGQYQWFWQHACTAKMLGIIHGHPDGSFRGEDTIILAEALKMSFEAWEVPLGYDDQTKPWYERYMDEAAARGIFKRFPFTPGYQLTRGEMALLLVMIGESIASLNPDAEPRTETVGFPIVSKGVCGNGLREGAEQCDDGNLLNDDGCSDICIIVSQPIRHGALRIEQQPVSNADQASGAKDVPLFAFTAIAGRQDVYITTLKFKSAAGSLQSAENYRLFIDRDGDGKTESLYGRANADGQTLTFSNLNILVKDGVYMNVELWADLDTTLSAGSLAIEFDTTQLDFVEGVNKIDGDDVTGIELNTDGCQIEDICWIEVFTQSSQTVTIRTQGNLFVTEDTVPLGSRQILASRGTASLLLLKMSTDSEDIIVKELAIEGVPTSVDRLEFFFAGSATPFATGKEVHCDTVVTGRVCTDQDFTVEQSVEKSVIVKAVLKSNELGAVSGQTVTLSVSAITSGNVAVTAEGHDSGQRLLQNDNNSVGEGEVFIGTDDVASNSAITGPGHTVVLARITGITNSNPDADGSLITAGGLTFADFRFTAADHDNTAGGASTADIDKLTFTVSAVNMEFESGSFYLFNSLNSSVTAPCSENATTGTITVTCSGLIASSVSTLISRGDSIRLALRATVSNAQSSPGVSILQASLNNLSNPGSVGTVEWTDGETSLGWVDIGQTNVKSTNYRLD